MQILLIQLISSEADMAEKNYREAVAQVWTDLSKFFLLNNLKTNTEV